MHFAKQALYYFCFVTATTSTAGDDDDARTQNKAQSLHNLLITYVACFSFP